jgi:Tfp pilus assembly protein PilO
MAQISLKSSSKGVTVLIIIAIVIFFGCTLGYLAVAGKLKGTAAEMQAKERKVTQGKEIAQKLEESKLDYLDARSQIRFLESSVATSAYVPTLLKQLESLGKSVNLNVIGIRPEAPKKQPGARKLSSGAQAANGNIEAASGQNAQTNSQSAKKPAQPYDELNIDIEVEGKYMNALDFIYKLTSFPKIIAIKSVQMGPGSGEVVSSPLLNIKMSITAYVLKDDAAGMVTGKVPNSGGRGGNEAG